MAQAPTESQGFFAVDYVGQIRNPKVNGVLVLMKQDEGPRVAGRLYTYEGDGVWDEVTGGGGGVFPSEDDVRNGIAFDVASVGNLVLPTAGQVFEGVGFGANGTEFTGTLDPGSGDIPWGGEVILNGPQDYSGFVNVAGATYAGDLKAAIDAGEQYLWLPEGEYSIDNPIILDRATPLYIHGHGVNVSQIRAQNESDPLFLINDVPIFSLAGVEILPPNPLTIWDWESFRFENTAPVVFEMQNGTYRRSMFHILGPGTFTFQTVVPLREDHCAFAIVVDHPSAELYFIGGNISQGHIVHGDNSGHIWVKQGHLEMDGVGLQASSGRADIRIDTASPKGYHVLSSVRSEGANATGNTNKSQLVYVPTTAAAVNVLIKACGISGFGTISGEIEFVEYNGTGTVWILGCNAGQWLTHWAVGTAPSSTIVALGNMSYNNSLLAADISTVNGTNIEFGNMNETTILASTGTLANVPTIPDVPTPPRLDRPRMNTMMPGMVDVTAAPYNAVGDGVADDTAAIQAAIDDEVGYKLYFPAGTYNLSSDTALLYNVSTPPSGEQSIAYGGMWAGAGAHLTTIHNTTGYGCFASESLAYFAFQGITFRDEEYGGGPNVQVNWTTGYKFASQEIIFTDCHFWGGLYGLSIGNIGTQQCDNMLLVNCKISRAQYGFVIGHFNALQNVIHNVLFEGNLINIAHVAANPGGTWVVLGARFHGTHYNDINLNSKANGSTAYHHGIVSDTPAVCANGTGVQTPLDKFFDHCEFSAQHPVSNEFMRHGCGAGLTLLYCDIPVGQVRIATGLSENYAFKLHSNIASWPYPAGGTSQLYELTP